MGLRHYDFVTSPRFTKNWHWKINQDVPSTKKKTPKIKLSPTI